MAGWDTTLFDGSSKLFGHGYDRAEQAKAALAERYDAAQGITGGSTTPDIALRRFGSRWSLEEVKSEIETLLGRFDWVDMSQADTSGKFDTYFAGETHPSSPFDSTPTPQFPLLDKATLCSNAGAPSDWFDNTPYFGAAANEYGWKYVDDIINQLVAIEYGRSIGDYDYRSGGGEESTWSDAKTAAETDYGSATWSPTTSYDASTAPFQLGTDNGDGTYSAYVENVRIAIDADNTADIAVRWSAYLFACGLDHIFPSADNTFDDYGTGLGQTYAEHYSASLAAAGTSANTLTPSMPGTWPAEPGTDDTARGHQLWAETRELWEFDVTDGLDYVVE